VNRGGVKQAVIILLLFTLLASIVSADVQFGDIVINEFLADAQTEPQGEWIELFNNASNPINLEGWNITEGSRTSNFTLPALIMEPGSFLILVRDDLIFNNTYNSSQFFNSSVPIVEYGPTAPGIQLNNGGDEIVLYNGTKLIANHTYASSSQDISEGRFPDGNLITTFTIPTPTNRNDNLPPVLNRWISPVENSSIKGVVNITINISDDVYAINTSLVDFNSINNTMSQDPFSTDLWTFIWDTTLNLDGTYNLSLFTNDTIGLSSSHLLQNITVDNTPPNVTFVSPPASSIVTATTTFSFSVFDTTSPDLVILNITNSTNSISFTITSMISTFTKNFDTTTLADGNYNASVFVNDTLNNINNTEFIPFTIDNSGPIIIVNTPANNSNVSGTITLNSTVADISGLGNVFFNISNATDSVASLTATPSGNEQTASLDTSTLGDGLFNIFTFSNDTLNNRNDTEFVIILIDNTPPNVTFNNPLNGANLSGIVTLNSTITDALSVDTTFFNVTNATDQLTLLGTALGGEETASLDTTTLSDGAYNITVFANDTLNNLNASEFLSVFIDNTAPNVTINAPSNGEIVSGAILINVTIDDTLLLTVVLLNVTNVTDSESFNFTILPLGVNEFIGGLPDGTLADGAYDLNVTTTDAANNTNNTESITFTVDNTPPNVTINSPLTNTNVSGTITLNATPLDTSGISNTFFNITNTTDSLLSLQASPTGSSQNATLDTTTLLDGQYSIFAVANDTLNNTNTTEFSSVIIDNTPPTITVGSCAPQPANLTQSVTCNATVTDNLVGLSTVEANVTMPDGTNVSQTVIITGTLAEFTFNSVPLRGFYNITWVANDTLNNIVTESANFTVQNRAPVQNLTIADLSWPEDSNFTVNLSDFFFDEDGDNITFLNTSGPSNIKVFINDTTNQAILQPNLNFNGLESVVFTASDGFGGATASSNITLNVTPVNDAPTIFPGVPNITLVEDSGSFSLTLTPNEVDVDDAAGTGPNNNLTWSVSGHDASIYNLSVFSTLDLLIFTTLPNVVGNDTLIVTLTDSGGLTASNEIIVNITPVNDAPKISSIPDQTVTEDTPFNLDLTPFLSDADNLISALIVTTNSTNAVVTGQNITFNYPNQTIPSESVRINVTDGQSNTTAEVNISVTFVNDAPVIAVIPLQTIKEDSPTTSLNLTPFISDEETAVNALILTLVNENFNQVDCSINNQNLSFTPASNFSGLAICGIQISDSSATASSNISINVTPVNDKVIFTSNIPDQSIDEDTTRTINLTQFWSDADNDTLIFSTAVLGPSIAVLIDNSTSQATLRPVANFSGLTWMILNATDGETSAASNNVTITVNEINDEVPVISAFPRLTFNEDSSNSSLNLSDFVEDLDTPDDQIIWTKLGDPNIIFSVSPTKIATFSAVSNFCGTTAIVLRANDSINSDDEALTVDVNCVQDLPEINLIQPPDNSIINSTSVILTWNGSDADNDTLLFNLHLGTTNNPPFNLSTTETTAVITGLADNQQYFWKVIANDSFNAVATPIRQFTVTTNFPPVINSFQPTNTAPTVAEGSSLAFSVSASDADNDPLTFNWLLDESQVSSSNSFIFNPGLDDSGIHIVKVNVTDPAQLSATQVWTVTVSETNTPPSIIGTIPSQTLIEDGSSLTLDLTPFESDSQDGNSGLTWTVSGVDSTLITISINAATDDAVITPIPNAFGSNTVTFTLTDSGGLTATQSVLITVTSVNDQPEIISFTPLASDPKIGNGKSQIFSINATDPDGTIPTITWFVGNVQQASGETFTFTPASIGTFNIRADVADGTSVVSQSWTLTVSNVPILNAFNGGTTFNVTTFNESQLQSVNNFVIERAGIGRIEWLEPVDLTDVVDLNNLIIIQNNLISVDSSVLTSLNRKARITLFNVNVANPVVLFGDGFSSSAASATAFCDFCTIVSSLNNQIVFDVDHFTIFTVVSSTSSELIIPSSVTIGPKDAARNTTVDSFFTISNGGTFATLTNVQVKGLVPSQYNLKFSSNNIEFTPTLNVGTLNPLAPAKIFVRASIPRREDGGLHDIGDITISSTQSTKTISEVFIHPKSFLRIKNVEVDGDDLSDGGSADIKPDTNIDIEVKVENTGDIDVDNVKVEVTIFDIRSGNRDIEEESDDFKLKDGDDDTVTIKVRIPDDLDENEYDIRIEVKGTDDNGARHIETLQGVLDVQKDDHDLRLTSDLSADELSCNRAITIQTTVKNLGDGDEDDVRITVTNPSLGINEESATVDLDENDRLRRSFSLNLENAKVGSYTVDVRVYRDDNNLEDSQALPLKITECVQKIEEDLAELEIRQRHQQLLNSLFAKQETPNVVVKDNSNGLFWAVVISIMVINLGVVAFAVGAAVIKKQKQQALRPTQDTAARSVIEMRKLKDAQEKPRKKRRKKK
jgi:hypothetical protein